MLDRYGARGIGKLRREPGRAHVSLVAVTGNLDLCMESAFFEGNGGAAQEIALVGKDFVSLDHVSFLAFGTPNYNGTEVARQDCLQMRHTVFKLFRSMA